MEIILSNVSQYEGNPGFNPDSQILFSVPNSALYSKRNDTSYVIKEFERICSVLIMNLFSICTKGATLREGFRIGEKRTIIILEVSSYCDLDVLDRIKMINKKTIDMEFAYGMKLLHKSPLSVLLKRNDEVFSNGLLLVDIDTSSEYIIRRQNHIERQLKILKLNYIACPKFQAMSSVEESILNQILDEFDITQVYSDKSITIYGSEFLMIDPIESYHRVMNGDLPLVSFSGSWSRIGVDREEIVYIINMLLPGSYCVVTFDGVIYCEVCCLRDLSFLNIELEKYERMRKQGKEYLIPNPIRVISRDTKYLAWGNYMKEKI